MPKTPTASQLKPVVRLHTKITNIVCLETTKRRKVNASQAINLQAKKKAAQALDEDHPHNVTASQKGVESFEDEKDAFWGMLSLLIRCHEKENADVMTGV